MAMEQFITEHLDLWATAIKYRSIAGRGSSSKVELYGIKKLRELILELAVRGLLVPQDPKDEPTSELLKKIAAEKVKLAKEGKIKKDKSLPPVSDEERPFQLPKGWSWERFGNLAEHNAGKTLDQGRNQGELRDYITTSNLYWGKFDLSGVRQMPIEDTDLENCQAIQNDLLICEGGEAGRAAVWNHDYSICFQNHIHRARFWQGISPYYAYRMLEKMNYSGEINNYRKGVAISNMSGKALGSIPFPLPPLAEQHRIVAKVDELMALCDHLEQQTDASLSAHQTLVEALLNALTSAADHAQLASNWQRIAEHFDTLFTTEESIDQLKQSILQLAVMGKLVPQDPQDESASELLKKIAVEKAKLAKEKKIKSDKPLTAIAEEEVPFELPLGWAWSRFDGLIDPEYQISYGVLVPGPDVEDGVPFVRIEDLSLRNPTKQPNKKISADIDQQYARTRLVGGEILMGVVGSIGKLGIAPESWRGANIARAVCRIVPTKFLYRDYIVQILQSTFMQKSFVGDTRTLAQPTLNIGFIRDTLTPVPPVAEQRRIAAKVDELVALCNQLKARLSESQATQLNLADALTEKALAEA